MITDIKRKLWHYYYENVCRYMKSRMHSLYSVGDYKKAVKYVYWMAFCRYPNLKNPRTINEKLQVLKLNDYYDNPIITQCVDKFRVKDYLDQKGFGDLCAHTYGVYQNATEINWDTLPEKFVIKCNHGCGYNILVKDKKTLDIQKTVSKLDEWMREDSWKLFAEYQYMFVNRNILIEQYLGERLNTYKFYCFHGEPKVIYVSQANTDGIADYYLDYFDIDWNHLDIHLGEHPWNPNREERPDKLEKMLQICRELSSDFPFVRVDLYYTNEQIYFSEFTFMPTGGYMQLTPEWVAKKWGDWLNFEKK